MRFIVSLGVGGLGAVDVPLMQEFVPASKRGFISGLSLGLLPLGPLLAALLSATLGATIGWRGLFAIGVSGGLRLCDPAVGAGVAALAARKGRFEEARRSLAWALKLDPVAIRLPATVARRRNRHRGLSCSNIRAASSPEF